MLYSLSNSFTFFSNSWFSIALWIIICIVALIIEGETFQFVSIWFAISAFITLILAVLKVDFLIQLIVFTIVSTLLVILTRPFVKKLNSRKSEMLDVDSLVGQIVTVTKPISKDCNGEIKARYERFTAITNSDCEFVVGDKVKISKMSGNHVEVEKE